MGNNSWLSHPIVTFLGLIGTLITIFVFLTGIASVHDLLKGARAYLIGAVATSTPVQPVIIDTQGIAGTTATSTLTPDLPSPTPVVEVTTPVTPKPTDIPLPTFTNAPTPCGLAVDSDVQRYWSSDLGCPIEPSHITWASFTPFQKGFMMWRDDTRKIYGFFDGVGWDQDEDRFVEGMPDRPTPNRGDAPPGLLSPTRGTGLVWETNETFFSNLGWARIKQKGFCARVQNFTGGFIVYDSGIGSCFDSKSGQQQSSRSHEPDFEFTYVKAYYSGRWEP